MPDFTITVTDPQLRALRKLDPVLTARQVMQIHVDTWLAPVIAEMVAIDRTDVIAAYRAATPGVRDQVKGLLGLT